MSEEVDLYDDLPVLSFGESVSKIEEERQYFKEQLTVKEKDLEKIKEQISILEKEKKTLEENISSLYKTAVNEIKRKDQIIADLRREKDSIIFRRSGRWNNSVNSASCTQNKERDVGSSSHNDFASPTNHTSIHDVNEESRKTVSAIISSSDTKTKGSNECLHKTSEKTPFLYEKKKNFHHQRKSDIKDTVLNPVASENCSSKDPDTFDHFSYSHPLHIPRQINSPEQSSRKKSSQNVRESRSLSSESRRECKPKQSNNCWPPKARHASPYSKYRSSSAYNEKGRRDDKLRHHSDNRNNFRDRHKENSRRDEKYKVRNCNEFSDRYNVHSRRSPSPKLHRRHALNPSERNYHSRSVRTNTSRNTKMQTDNVRLATQLKIKYSKAMRERSLSRTPVKQKIVLRKSCSPVSESSNQSSRVMDNSALKQDVEKNVASKHIYNGNLKAKKLFTETMLKPHEIEASNCADTVVLSLQKESNECKQIKKQPDSGVTVGDSVQNHTSTINQNCGVAVDIETKPSHLKQENINFPKECVYDVKKEELNELLSDTNYSLENDNLSRTTSGVTRDNIHNSLKINNNPLYSVQTLRNEKSFLMMNADSVTLLSKEKSSHEELPTRLLSTPPCKNLVPLKISPSFENPAVVEERRFSHCVFNEQCEFKRHKRKKFKKLLVTDLNNENITNTKEKDYTKPSNEQYFESDSSEQHKFNSGQQINFDSVKDCDMDDKMNSLSSVNINLKNGAVCNSDINNDFPNKTIVNKINPVGNCSKGDVHLQESVKLLDGDLETNVLPKSVNISCELPNNKVHRRKSPNKKRKLDSICEELKANLEKKTNANSAAMVTACTSNILSLSEESGGGNVNPNDNEEKTTSVLSNATNLECAVLPRETNVHSDKITKRVVVSKRRRRVPNLQDNVVQVLTQVKSTTP